VIKEIKQYKVVCDLCGKENKSNKDWIQFFYHHLCDSCTQKFFAELIARGHLSEKIYKEIEETFIP
jgi:hypothetical protein